MNKFFARGGSEWFLRFEPCTEAESVEEGALIGAGIEGRAGTAERGRAGEIALGDLDGVRVGENAFTALEGALSTVDGLAARGSAGAGTRETVSRADCAEIIGAGLILDVIERGFAATGIDGPETSRTIEAVTSGVFRRSVFATGLGAALCRAGCFRSTLRPASTRTA